MKIKLVLIILTLMLSACDSETCIYILDKDNKPIRGISLSYETVRNPKYDDFQTSRDFINKINVGVSDSEGKICFIPKNALILKERSLAFSWILESENNRKIIKEDIFNDDGVVNYP